MTVVASLGAACAAAPPDVTTLPPVALASAAPPSSAAPVTVDSPPVEPAAVPRTVKLSFVEKVGGPGKRDVFLVSDDAAMMRALLTYDEAGACTLGPLKPSRSRGRAPEAELTGIALECGIEGNNAVALSIDDGLRVGGELVAPPPGVTFELPTRAPERLEGACPPDAPKQDITATVALAPRAKLDDGDVRRVVLRLSGAVRRDLPILAIYRTLDCSFALSKKHGWLQQSCRSGVRWQHHSTWDTFMRMDGRVLRADTAHHSIDDRWSTSAMLTLPCGARVRFVGRRISALGREDGHHCFDGCGAIVGPCEDRCLEAHGTEAGEVDEAGAACQQACQARGNDCQARCGLP